MLHEEEEQAVDLGLLNSRDTALLTSRRGPTSKSFQHETGMMNIQIITPHKQSRALTPRWTWKTLQAVLPTKMEGGNWPEKLKLLMLLTYSHLGSHAVVNRPFRWGACLSSAIELTFCLWACWCCPWSWRQDHRRQPALRQASQ